VSGCCPVVGVDDSLSVIENRTINPMGLWRSLGARFHGMEEVVGSIPTRSTNFLNNLDGAMCFGCRICDVLCVITCRSCAC
jgi:hypothetical protein